MTTNKKIICIVDRGNISRSPVAAAIIRKRLEMEGLQNQYEVISRGVQGTSVDPKLVDHPNITYYSSLYEHCKPWLDEHKIDLSAHVSTPITKDIAEKVSIMFATDRKTQHALLLLYPNFVGKIHLLSEIVLLQKDITDPVTMKSSKELDQVFNEINTTIEQGFPSILAFLASPK